MVDAGDPFGVGTVIPFNRSQYDNGPNTISPGDPTGVPGQRREVVNSITSYIDASNVYGSDTQRTANLRTFSGGRLKSSQGGLLLPLNTVGEENADQFGEGAELFLAGDVRANEQVNLTAVHTLFMREHNRLAARIHDLYPNLNDEQIFQVARRLVGAEQQVITYQEYLPALMGYDLAPDPYEAVYDTDTDGAGPDLGVDASITNSFAHALFRFGHSQINETTLLVNAAGEVVDELDVDEAFFNEEFLKEDPGRVGRMLKGLASQTGQEVDLFLTDGIRNNLFGPPGAGGLDLGALDIQRGRDHGLPDFNNLRGNYGQTQVTSFAQITSNATVQLQLQQLYGNVNNIDPFVGALAEDHLPGTSVGPLLAGVLGNQFVRLRDGDRFFYTIDPFLNRPEVKAILDVKNVRLADVIRWNTNVVGLQDNVFFDRTVIFIQSPAQGSNLSVVAALGVVTVIDNNTLSVISVHPLSEVSTVVLVGSRTNSDVFNLFIASANGGLENGVVAFGRGGSNDVLNVFGRVLTQDTFVVSCQEVNADHTAGPDADVVVPNRVDQITIMVNGNKSLSTGFETTRIVTLGGSDVIIDPDLIALVVSLWDPTDDD